MFPCGNPCYALSQMLWELKFIYNPRHLMLTSNRNALLGKPQIVYFCNAQPGAPILFRFRATTQHEIVTAMPKIMWTTVSQNATDDGVLLIYSTLTF